MKKVDSISGEEILASAISLEEERVNADLAEELRENFPASAAVKQAAAIEAETRRSYGRATRRANDADDVRAESVKSHHPPPILDSATLHNPQGYPHVAGRTGRVAFLARSVVTYVIFGSSREAHLAKQAAA